MSLDISVIISTYNQPIWLKKVLIGYEQQTFKNFEIIIADDGSTEDTKAIIEQFKSTSRLTITHVWQEDDGFRKTRILNKAIKKSKTSYLIFTDGDCIPRADFVATHLKLKKENSFLSGGYFKLPLSISEDITEEDIKSQRCFNKKWLIQQGLKKSFKTNKLTASGFKEQFLNTMTPTKATFDGMNVSVWKNDVVEVNGFDERMAYGGEDRELGERLMNLGIKPLQIRYSAICLHLDHKRSYVNDEALAKNRAIRKATKKNKLIWTNFGLIRK
ncbi:MAG: glycosyltransferase family 2 protein [Flavobacteriaceae bacterium]|nr:glycosyltransferase family 2 protein [Flavobacteriaceae bacterium]